MRSVQGGGGARCAEGNERKERQERAMRLLFRRQGSGGASPGGVAHAEPEAAGREPRGPRGEHAGAGEARWCVRGSPGSAGRDPRRWSGRGDGGRGGRAGGVDVLRGQRGHSACYSGGSATPRTSCARSGGVVTGAPWLSVDVRDGVAVAGGRQGATGPRRGLIPTLRFQNPVGTGTC